jgi:hypothetical protein
VRVQNLILSFAFSPPLKMPMLRSKTLGWRTGIPGLTGVGCWELRSSINLPQHFSTHHGSLLQQESSLNFPRQMFLMCCLISHLLKALMPTGSSNSKFPKLDRLVWPSKIAPLLLPNSQIHGGQLPPMFIIRLLLVNSYQLKPKSHPTEYLLITKENASMKSVPSCLSDQN